MTTIDIVVADSISFTKSVARHLVEEYQMKGAAGLKEAARDWKQLNVFPYQDSEGNLHYGTLDPRSTAIVKAAHNLGIANLVNEFPSPAISAYMMPSHFTPIAHVNVKTRSYHKP